MKNILVVEDDQFLVESYKTKLETEHFKVSIAHDGTEALKILEEGIPDLIILDIIMPKMDGITFLKNVKQNTKYSKIPVIIASNIDKSESVVEAMKIGAVDYFVKSNISINDLVAKCKKVTTS